LKNPHRLFKNAGGSVAVEFALFLPLLLILIFGVVELGSAWYSKQMLVNASREGARLGALLNPGDLTDSDVRTHVLTLLSSAGYPGSPTVTVSGVADSSGSVVSVQVESTHALPVLGALVPAALGTVNLSATTVMRHE
jgi:Flp pilus assembly protein TadG